MSEVKEKIIMMCEFGRKNYTECHINGNYIFKKMNKKSHITQQDASL